MKTLLFFVSVKKNLGSIKFCVVKYVIAFNCQDLQVVWGVR